MSLKIIFCTFIVIVFLTKVLARRCSDCVINTEGCQIPNFNVKFQDSYSSVKKCGNRKIFLKRVSNSEVQFLFTEYLSSCCYEFVDPFSKTTKCKEFKNNSHATIQYEMIRIKCYLKKHSTYRDTFTIVKKENFGSRDRKRRWNVLMIGIDTMSRKRFVNSFIKTRRFLEESKWIDFRGYTKVASNTYPNLMVLMTGKNRSAVDKKCPDSFDKCNSLMIWSNFRKAGYVTAYAEDVFNPTFKYNITKPTDHYVKFVESDKIYGGLQCTGQITSPQQVLNYALEFVEAYKNDPFFGFFWMSTIGHDTDHAPKSFDAVLLDFFKRIKQLGVLKKTFVFLLSDHGIRFGPVKFQIESFYEERLPMLHVKPPDGLELDLVRVLQRNSGLLVSPYDLHLTLLDIQANNYKYKPTLDSCRECKSLLFTLPGNRTCDGASINEKWCSCYSMHTANFKTYGTVYSTIQAVIDVTNSTRNIQTKPNKKCAKLELKWVLRTHYYNNTHNGNQYYIIAFVTTPGNASYEAIVRKDLHFNYTLLRPTDHISSYKNNGGCVLKDNLKHRCICVRSNINIAKKTKKTSTKKYARLSHK